uniref:JmjC domain-containing protein n=2 Tax=Ciona savignyi TaxID=51511 RepID=H2YUZ2_CIOSA
MLSVVISTAVLLFSLCSGLSPDEIKRLESMPGHLKPFGSMGPFFDVPVVEEYPETREFFNKYVVASTPLVLKGVAKKSLAYLNWTDEYFINHPSSVEDIFAEARVKENRSKGGFVIPFRSYVKHYTKRDMYMVNGVPKFLKPDVLLPEPLKCEEVRTRLSDTVMWYSNGGTKSVLHNDDVDNINCLYRGNKTLTFVNRFDTDQEWVDKVIDHPDGSYSGIDVDSVDFVKYPLLANTRYGVVHMEAGDCLFIPFKWHHQVNSFGNNLAINIWFNHLPHLFVDLDADRCGNTDNKITLDQCEFETKDAFSGSTPQKEIVFNKNYDENAPQVENEVPSSNLPPPEDDEEQEGQSLLYFTIYQSLSRTPRIDQEDFKTGIMMMLPSSIQQWDASCDVVLGEIFKAIDMNGDGVLSIEDFGNFSPNKITPEIEDLAEQIETLNNKLMVQMRFALDNNTKVLISSLVKRGEISQEHANIFYGENFVNTYQPTAQAKQEL